MNRELIMQTLFARLTGAPLVFNFTADTAAGDPVLFNISDTSGLAVGMPVFGPAIPAGTTIAALTPVVALSNPAAAAQAGIAMSQGLQTYGRRLKPWTEVAAQPALFLVQANETFPGLSDIPARQSSVPARIELLAYAWIYARAADPDSVPDTLLNVLLDALEQALDPPPTAPTGRWQSLGLSGVLHARIEGELLRDGGHFDGHAVCRVPIAVRAVQGATIQPLT
jgi:hypothetical protein